MSILPERLKGLLKEKDMTQIQLASIVSIDRTTLSNYMTGRIKRPRRSIINAICKALDITEEYLLGDVRDEEAKMREYKYNTKFTAIRKHCHLGMDHWCDGTINKSQAKQQTKVMSACPYYKAGRCREPHIRGVEEE